MMVTGKSARRLWLAARAYRCFADQTHANRELVIVNTSSSRLDIDDEHVVEYPAPADLTLGALRNIGLELATGDLVTLWDDDDWNHPERLERQWRAHKPGCLTILRRQYRVDLKTGCYGVFDARVHNPRLGGVVGTMMFDATGHRFPAKARGEDRVFKDAYGARINVVDNEAQWFVRLYHGANTWERHKILGRLDLRHNDTDSFVRDIADRYSGLPEKRIPHGQLATQWI